MNKYRDKDDRTIWIPFPEDALRKDNGFLGTINLTRMRGNNGKWIYSLHYYDHSPTAPFREYSKDEIAGFTLGQNDTDIRARVNSYIEKFQDFARAILREF